MSMRQQKKNYRKRTVEELGEEADDKAKKSRSDDEEERRYGARDYYCYRKVNFLVWWIFRSYVNPFCVGSGCWKRWSFCRSRGRGRRVSPLSRRHRRAVLVLDSVWWLRRPRSRPRRATEMEIRRTWSFRTRSRRRPQSWSKIRTCISSLCFTAADFRFATSFRTKLFLTLNAKVGIWAWNFLIWHLYHCSKSSLPFFQTEKLNSKSLCWGLLQCCFQLACNPGLVACFYQQNMVCSYLWIEAIFGWSGSFVFQMADFIFSNT